MKATGIVRKIDELGRIVLPKETRTILGIEEGTPMEIFTDGNRIVLQKHTESCTGCGSLDVVKSVGGLKVCQKCLDALTKATGNG